MLDVTRDEEKLQRNTGWRERGDVCMFVEVLMEFCSTSTCGDKLGDGGRVNMVMGWEISDSSQRGIRGLSGHNQPIRGQGPLS